MAGKRKIKDLTGTRFGRWTVLRMVAPLVTIRGRRHITYTACLCRCDCGTERVIRAGSLRQGQSRSCGCSRQNPLPREAGKMATRKVPARKVTCEYVPPVEVARGYVPPVEVSDDEWMFGPQGSKGLFAAR